ncbi:hypothetical protein BpHYR1_023962 [Brachionus plicatilis]|uniref:Uncharacterized protein n=1 Tax=Brachionus plicatilis TaxID=10195 RepID=A0A3M7SQG0_BRAPC|nr:hypothetical protein BpHYR1_023962 [Brachionus plicatilis]
MKPAPMLALTSRIGKMKPSGAPFRSGLSENEYCTNPNQARSTALASSTPPSPPFSQFSHKTASNAPFCLLISNTRSISF